MAEHKASERTDLALKDLLQEPGLLDQFNLPPALIKFLRRNQRSIWIIIICILLVVIGALSYNAYIHNRERNASLSLELALSAGAEKEAKLEQLLDEYGSTAAALWAGVELARGAEEAGGQEEKAISHLEKVLTALPGRSPLQPLVLSKLGVLYENTKNYDKALASYAALEGMEEFATAALAAMGRVCEQAGQKDQAISHYKKYLERTAAVTGPSQAVALEREMIKFRLVLLQK